ncbi:MAG: DHHA1 domain-containing protein [Planctomycetota bacterium]
MVSPELAESFQRLRELVERKQRFVLSGHQNIDGDSLGSMVAFFAYLRRLGKQVTAFSLEPISNRYDFVDLAREVRVFDAEEHAQLVQSADVFMAFDLCTPARLGRIPEFFADHHPAQVYVDHHPLDGPRPGHLNVMDATQFASGKIVYDYLKFVGAPLDASMALGLLTAILTDTGWFRYSNTSAETFRVVHELEPHSKVRLHELYRAIYQRNEINYLRMLGSVVAGARVELGGRVLWSTIPLCMVKDLGLVPGWETDAILDVMRSGDGVEAVALFRELPDGRIRVNLRSRGVADVNLVARGLGGGGHRHAAGATIDGPLERESRRVVQSLVNSLEAT